jgi:sialic acid synthase SpsE
MKNPSTYIIGEIGQNHNGSVDLAKLLTEMVARKIDDALFNYNLKGMEQAVQQPSFIRCYLR